MNTETKVSIKFKNYVDGLKKVENYANSLSKVQASLGALDKDKMQQVDDNATNMSHIANTLGNIGKSVKVAFNFEAIKKFTQALGNSYKTMVKYTQASSDYLENLNLYQVAFEGNYKEANKFVAKMSEMYGLDESWLYNTVGIFKQLTNAMNLSVETGTKLSKLLTQMSLDISSLYNVDIERASQVLQSAMAGQTRPIRGVTGADITQATLQTTLDELGIDRTINKLNYAEKRLLIIVSLTKQINEAIGDMGRTIESPSNQMRILNEQWNRLTRAIGNVFLPILSKILPYLNAVLMVLTDIINLVASLFGYKEDDYNFVAGFSDDFLDMTENIDGATDSLDKLDKTMRGLRGFDKLNNITTPTSASSDTGVGGGGIDPKIMSAFNDAFDEYQKKLDDVNMKAKQIADKLRNWLGITDGTYKNLKLIGAILGVIAGYKLIKGVAGLITGTSTLSKILGTGGLYGALKKILEPIAVLGMKDGLAYIFLDATKKLKTFLPVAGKVAVVLGSIVAVVGGSAGLYKSMKNLTLGIKDSNKEWGKFTKSMLATVGGATTLGAVIGGPLGAGIGALVGLLIGGTSALIGYNSALTQIAKSNVFGTLSISQQQWSEILENSGPQITNFVNKIQELQDSLSVHNDAFTSATNSLSMYALKMGRLGVQISEEDVPLITEAIQTMGTEATAIIDETTQTNVSMWATLFDEMDTITSEEENSILKSMTDYGEKQKKEIADAQNNITTTYDNAIKSRGYLTDEEYKYISEQLAKIRQVTETEMTRNQANIEYYKTEFANKNLALDEESYTAFNTALKKYQKEKQEQIEKEYQTELQSAESYRKSGVINEEKYNELIDTANKKRLKAEQETREYIKSTKDGVYKDLANHYASILDKTDKESKNEKKIIENVFKNINIDKSEIVSKFADVGKSCAEAIGKGFNQKKLKLNYDITEIAGGQASIKPTGGFKASWEYAQGGLPPVGQLFVANEKGPELIGHIGGQTFVANQNQMLDLLDKKIGNTQTPQTQIYNINVGSEKLATVVLKDMNKLAKVEGKPIEIMA